MNFEYKYKGILFRSKEKWEHILIGKLMDLEYEILSEASQFQKEKKEIFSPIPPYV